MQANQSYRTVVVEDKVGLRKDLISNIEKSIPAIQVVGEAGSVVEALRIIKETAPDLLLLDIELPDGTAFDILQILDDPPQIIFTTGADQYAVSAFRYAAVDYLLKPVSIEDIKGAIERIDLRSDKTEESLGVLKEHLANTRTRIALHTQDRLVVVPIKDIIRCESDGNYTRFILRAAKPLLVAKTLKEYDELLSDSEFLRVHQSHLVNLMEVRAYVRHDGGYLEMADGSKVPVSTRKRTEVIERISSIG